jgi:Thaumatin family
VRVAAAAKRRHPRRLDCSACTLVTAAVLFSACAPQADPISPGPALRPRSGGSGGETPGGGSSPSSEGGGGGGTGAGPTGGGASGGAPGGSSPRGGGAADAGTSIDSPASSGAGGSGNPGAQPPGTQPPGAPNPLPLVVTDHFQNRGWFGDGSITMFFKTGATLIKEAPSVTGPCANRPAGAKGKCLQITYTPPAGLAAPAKGAFVGVYFLPTLRASHPEANAKVGDPNWGIEPGVPVAPGAKRLTFYGAADQPTRVAFRGGTDKDNIYLPEAVEILEPKWTQYSISLAGGDTGGALLGGFAWTIKDTTKPATFYIDGIVWDGEGPTPPKAPPGKMDGKREVVVINNCKQPVWVAISSQQPVPEGGGFRLDAGQTRTLAFPSTGLWSGRIWGRTGCTFDASGMGRCDTGDCGGRLGCAGIGGKTPATLAEITWSAGPPNPDFYDLSLVDGYNLPMAMAPLPGSHGKNPAAYDCLTPSCVTDLNATCPGELQVRNGGGQVVGCLSACEKFGTEQFCCRGAHDQPETCPPFSFSKTFKAACPTAYSYAYDDATSTFTCKGEDYAVWFCP